MPESIEQWLWLIISVIFIGFAFLVILVLFHSLIVWLCLGLLVVIMLLYPIVRNLPTKVSMRRQCRAQDHQIEQQELLLSVNKQKQLSALRIGQQQMMPEVQQSSLEEPDVQKYIPPGLPPELFL
jgi:ABC-type bacteriocin/lantibiotic exporter with double-glycine peptidase domain